MTRRDDTTALHTAVQSLIYEVDLAYQPDGRPAVDANADEACDIPDRSHARVADGGIQPAQLLLPPVGVRSIVMSMSVRLSARVSQKPHGRTSLIFVHVARGRGSVLLWWRCDKLCTSGFVNDVTFSDTGPIARHMYS